MLAQQMMRIDSLPTQGTLTYLGGAVGVGQIVPVAALGSLRYTHDGTDLAVSGSDGFNVTVSDGGGGQTAGTLAISVAPANAAPTLTGTPNLVEGQVKAVAPAIDFGDAFDTQ